jgi:phospholipid transport system substrate-binding protein
MQPEQQRMGALVLALALLGLGAGAAAAAVDPTEAARVVVEKTVSEVLLILNEPGLDSEQRRERIERIAFEVFDFSTMSKLTLAKNWKRFDEAQREEFVSEFKAHLSRRYGTRLDRYQQTGVTIVGTQLEPRNDVTVRSKVVGGEFDGVALDYRMRETDGRWLVIDVVIEGVSLVANFRSQFAEVISQGGPEELLRQLKSKNFDAREESAAPKAGQG